MTSTTADELFDPIELDIADKQRAVAIMIAEHVKDRVGVNIEHVGNHIIRSKPGEPPRRETGRLQDSITGDAQAHAGIIESIVYTDVPYAAELEKAMRPILTDIADNYITDQLDAAKDGIEGA